MHGKERKELFIEEWRMKNEEWRMKNEEWRGEINGLEILNCIFSKVFKNKQFFKDTVHVIFK